MLKNKIRTILITSLLYSCQTPLGDVRPEGVVVERNKQVRPVWVDLPTERIVSASADSKLHFAKFKQRDLPIAIKTTQSLAVESSFSMWLPIFNERMKQVPKFNQIQSKGSSTELDLLMTQLSRKQHSIAAQIDDIYYEKIRIDDPSKVPELAGVSEYYDVHVLILLKPLEDKQLHSSIKKIFLNSKQAEWRKWAQELKI